MFVATRAHTREYLFEQYAHREPTAKEKLGVYLGTNLSSFSYRFVAVVAELLKVNPIKTIIDTPPSRIREFLNPKKYVESLELLTEFREIEALVAKRGKPENE